MVEYKLIQNIKKKKKKKTCIVHEMNKSKAAEK